MLSVMSHCDENMYETPTASLRDYSLTYITAGKP